MKPHGADKRNGHRPRLAFVGLGWIGVHRLNAIAASDEVEIAALYDEQRDACEAASQIAPNATIISSYDEILEDSIDGVVIATPNAFHVTQTVAALRAGISVFCQKPLGCNVPEVWQAVSAARESDCLLGVDFSYRFIPGMQQIRKLVQDGELGQIFSVDLKFHNGYGPDKKWFYERAASGGGCVLDLGIHLIDLALWTLDFPRVADVTSALFHQGNALKQPYREVEDYAVARMRTVNDVIMNLTCSWNLHVGADAEIEVCFYGTNGAASLRNVDGSFFDFAAERYQRSQRERLYETGSDQNWGGLAALDWCRRLAQGEKFSAHTEEFLSSAAVIDRIYARH
jgi:predicted dehydrogenase